MALHEHEWVLVVVFVTIGCGISVVVEKIAKNKSSKK